jgi:hypothetical protein
MAKRRGGRFKKMLGLGFISFEKAFNYMGKYFRIFIFRIPEFYYSPSIMKTADVTQLSWI